MTQKLIIDCDPGQDDAINLFLALPPTDAYDILGITVVAGNTSLEKVQRNARLLCELCGRTDIPVYAGCEAPLEFPLATAEEVHGSEGLEGVEIFEPDMPLQDQDAVSFIIETLRAAEDKSITLVPTGPLTNIGKALRDAPDIAPKIKEIVLMGGALREGGNITPSAEFNIYVDPHAARIVFDSGVPLIVFGLDVTHQVLTSQAVLDRIKAIGNKVSDTAYSLLTYYARFDEEKYAADGAPLHDPCTMAYILNPDLFTFKNCNIRVEVNEGICRGHTAVDFWYATDLPRNAQWAYQVDADGFFDLLTAQLKTYD